MNLSIKKTKEQLLAMWKKRGIRIGLSVVGVALLFLLLLPIAVTHGVQWWLVKNGADEAVISKLSVNLFTGTLSVDKVDVQGSKKVLFATSGSGLDFDIWSLFQKKIHIEKTYYDGVSIHIKQEEGGRWKIASYTTPEQPKTQPANDSEGLGWDILVDDVHISNSSIEISTPLFSTVITIDDAQLEKFSTGNDADSADFHFVGKIDNTPVVLESGKFQLKPDLMVAGQLSVTDFNTAMLSPILAGQLETIAGMFSMSGQFSVAMKDGTPGFRYDGDVDLAKTHLEMAALNYVSDHVHWSGTVDGKEELSQFLLDGVLNFGGLGVKIAGSGLEMNSNDVQFEGTTDIDLKTGFGLKNKGVFTSDNFALSMDEMALKYQKLEWKGRVDSSGKQPHYITNGALSVHGLNLDMNDGATQVSGETLTLDGITDIDLSTALKVAQTGSVVSHEFKVLVGEMAYGHEQLTWKGNITHTKSDVVATSATDGTLELENISYSKPGVSPLSLRLKNTSWQGALSYSPVNEDIFASLKLAGQVSAKGFEYDLAGTMPMDISLEDIALNDLEVGGEGVRLGTVVLDNLTLYSPVAKRVAFELQKSILSENVVSPEFAVASGAGTFEGFQLFPSEKKDGHSGYLEAVNFANFSWSAESGVALQEIVAQSLSIALVRDKNGSLNWGEQIASLKAIASTADVAESAEKISSEEVVPAKDIQKPSPGVTVGKFELTGDNTILFTDHTLHIPFRNETVLKQVLIENIDTLDAKQDISITVDALLEKRAPFTLTGKIRPFTAGTGDTEYAKLKFKLRNYPLLSLSPYLVQSVGTGLESGQLKLKGSFELKNGEVDVENDLLLKKLTTKAVAPELAAKLDSKLPVPLDTALSLLRDSDDNISLSIPISGPLDKLDFDLTSIFITALSKAVVPAASSYLMYALGPYGALAYVGMKIGENILEVHLPPVNFTAGADVLGADHKDYLQRVGKIIKEGNPESDLQVCPVSNVAVELGREGLLVSQITEEERQEVVGLGQVRAKVVQSYLADEQGVSVDRLLLCITRLEDGSNPSRVELQPEE